MSKYHPKMTESRIHKYLGLAKEACDFSDMHKTHLGSVLVYKSKIVSVGWNTDRTSPLQKEFNKFRNFDPEDSVVVNSIHSEMMCLHKAKDLDIEWGRASLFTYRVKKDGSAGLARSCPACYNYAKSLGLGNLYYSTETEKGWGYERIEY